VKKKEEGMRLRGGAYNVHVIFEISYQNIVLKPQDLQILLIQNVMIIYCYLER
jgi:hypothetical protein